MIVAIDLGSTHLKVVALGDRVVAARGPAPADPGTILDAAAGLVSEATEGLQENADGLALSGAMHTLLPVDGRGDPLGPVTTWADPAPGDRAGLDIAALAGPTGCPPWPLYHPARLDGMRRTDPAAFAGTARFIGLREWVFHRLTGRWWTDDVTASTTGLLDTTLGTWSVPMLDAIGITADQLPRIVAPSASATLRNAWAGLPKGLPVVVGSVDGALVHTALNATRPGDTTVSVGTTAALRTVLGAPQLDPAGGTWCYRMIGGSWLVGSAINNGGLLLDRVRSTAYPGLDPGLGFDRLFTEAASTPTGATGVNLSDFLVPDRDGTVPRSTGVPPALAGSATLAAAAVAHLAKEIARMGSAVEGVAGALGEPWLTGIAARRPLLAQAVTDALGIPTRVPSLPDPATVGAAILGFEALGLDAPSIDRSAQPIPPSGGDIRGA